MIEFKRVVTAVDRGKAVVSEETPLLPTTLEMMPGAEFYQLWGVDEMPPVPVEKPHAVLQPFFPGPGGSRFILYRIPPEGPGPQAALDEAMLGALIADAEEKLPGLVENMEPDAPGMHTTQTVDYGMVLEGEVWLELDDGAEVRMPTGSCVVQNGTRHAWRNRTDQPATLLFVLLGAPPA